MVLSNHGDTSCTDTSRVTATPAERLWPLTNEPLDNRALRSLDELEDVQVERCRWLQAHPDIIRGRTSFQWWPSLDTT